MIPKKTGILAVDENLKGIPFDDFAVLETDSFRAGLAFLAHYSFAGLQQSETCVFITNLPEKYFLQNMARLGMDFKPFLKKDQFIYLNYKPNVVTEISLTANFDDVFSEISRLSGAKKIDRIAIHQFDSLLNMSSVFLINSFAQKFAVMCRTKLTAQTSVLCEFQQFDDLIHNNLSISLQKMASAYYRINRSNPEKFEKMVFQVIKQPWFDFNAEAFEIDLSEKNQTFASTKKAG